MITTPTSLPDFTNPPVVEVALSVQFEPLKDLRTPQIGLLWGDLRARFPKIEEHPPLEPALERFGIKTAAQPGFRLQMMNVPPTPRLWFINEAGTELIQVQRDRFAHNWRKVGVGDAYPRYERLRETFRQELENFQALLHKEHLGDLTPNQCEVTYVNHITAGEGWTIHGQLGEVVRLFNVGDIQVSLPQLEDVRMALRYILPDAQGQPLGRLHISIEPVYRTSDDQAMFLMTLTARGRPDGNGIEGALRFLDTGRAWLGQVFTAITTPAMHKVWGRQDDR